MKTLLFSLLLCLPALGAGIKISDLPLVSGTDVGSLDSFPLVRAATNTTARVRLADAFLVPALASQLSGKQATLPWTTNGDMVFYSGGSQRLPKGLDGTILTMVDGIPAWTSGGSVPTGNLSSTTTGVTITGGVGAVVGTGATVDIQTANGVQPGLLSASAYATFAAKQAAGNYITSLTGDATASGPGAAAATVARVAGFTLSGLVAGDTLYASGAGTLARLAKGTDGQILTLASGVPTWADGGSGGGTVQGSWSATTGNVVTTNGASTAQDSGIAASSLAPKASPAFTTMATVNRSSSGDSSLLLCHPDVASGLCATVSHGRATGHLNLATGATFGGDIVFLPLGVEAARVTAGGGMNFPASSALSAGGVAMLTFSAAGGALMRFGSAVGYLTDNTYDFGYDPNGSTATLRPRNVAVGTMLNTPRIEVINIAHPTGGTINIGAGGAGGINLYTSFGMVFNGTTAAATEQQKIGCDFTGDCSATGGSRFDTFSGKNVIAYTALRLGNGANQPMLTCTLSGGTCTVSNTMTVASTDTQQIQCTHQTASGTLGTLSIGTKTAGTSFVVNSSNAADTSKVACAIINSAP